MEVTSYRDSEDPYVISHTARVFMAKPSKIFECHSVGPTGEIVVLNYKGFTKRVVVPKQSYRHEFEELEPLDFANLESPEANIPAVGFKRLLFQDEGRRNAFGERIFEYQRLEERKSRRKNK